MSTTDSLLCPNLTLSSKTRMGKSGTLNINLQVLKSPSGSTAGIQLSSFIPLYEQSSLTLDKSQLERLFKAYTRVMKAMVSNPALFATPIIEGDSHHLVQERSVTITDLAFVRP